MDYSHLNKRSDLFSGLPPSQQPQGVITPAVAPGLSRVEAILCRIARLLSGPGNAGAIAIDSAGSTPSYFRETFFNPFNNTPTGQVAYADAKRTGLIIQPFSPAQLSTDPGIAGLNGGAALQAEFNGAMFLIGPAYAALARSAWYTDPSNAFNFSMWELY